MHLFQMASSHHKTGPGKSPRQDMDIVNSQSEKMEGIIRNFEPRLKDVWIVTIPKSGTAWIQASAILALHYICQNIPLFKDMIEQVGNWRKGY